MRVVIPLGFALFILATAGCDKSGGASCSRFGDCEEADTSYHDESVDADPAEIAATDVEEPEFDNCTGNCSGHEAGFAWAQDNDVMDASECGGNSDSFIEGCEAFAEQRADLARELAEDAAYDAAEAEDYDSEGRVLRGEP